MAATYDTQNTQDAWDRVLLLLSSQPREGCEDIYHEVARRELERISVPTEERDGDE